jgi:15-cis-phytoene synthase
MKSATQRQHFEEPAGIFRRFRTRQNQIARTLQSNFYYSFLFLPEDKRTAIMDIYAFCREVDDAVDVINSPEAIDQNPFSALNEWRKELDACYGGRPTRSVTRRLAQTLEKFPMPKAYFEELISGCEMDLVKSRYETFDDLYLYCYRVASVIGLMCIEVFTYSNPDTREFAVNLGIALQLTNILRDLKEDATRGRIYLPQDELRRFGYDEDELLNGSITPRFRKLMHFECNRAAEYYERARNILPSEDRRTMAAAITMARIYYGLLKKIERRDYDVFSQRIRLHRPVRFSIAFAEWAKARIFNLDSP